MEQEFESKANFVKNQIEEDFKALNEQELEGFFEKFKDDKRTLSFLEYYNKTVLDKEKIVFSEFNAPQAWATHCSEKFYSVFDKNFDEFKEEIQKEKEKNIEKFFKDHCFEKDVCNRNGKELKKKSWLFLQ